jgi:LPXTG-motif cell wall-anchored protein
LKIEKEGDDANVKRKQDSNIKMPAVRKVLISCFLCAAVLVSGFTAYSLMMPAKTATEEKEIEISTVHTHTDDCYRMGRKLVCKSTDENHIHSEECYEERKILVCKEGEEESKAENSAADEVTKATEAVAENSTEAATEAVTEVITEAATEAQSIQEATTLSEKASEGETSKEQATQGEETTPKKGSKAAAEESAAEESAATDAQNYTDFVQYIEGRGGTISGVLRDSRGRYIRFIYGEEGEGYNYTITFSTRNGIETGNYKYELPQGLHVNPEARTGEIKFGDTAEGTFEAVGTFEVDEATGLLILKLGSKVVGYQDVSGTLGFGASMTASSGVEKKGYLVKSDDNSFDGYFHFDISAKIPAAKSNMLKSEWKFSDESYSPNLRKRWSYGFGTKVYEEKPSVYISYGDVSKREVKNIEDVYNDTSEDIAYYVDANNLELYLVNRCQCSSDGDDCVSSDSNVCKSILPSEYIGWCTCWNLDKDAVVDISYKNNINGYEFEKDQRNHPDKSIEDLKRDNGILAFQNAIVDGDVYNNGVTLKGRNRLASKEQTAYANVELLKFIGKNEKTVADENNNYIGKFEITVNPGKFDISALAKPNGNGVNVFTVNDTMKNLRYIKGSVQITAENAAGERFDLIYGEDKDYVVTDTYDPAGKSGKLEFQIMNIGAYKYTITYSARIDSDTNDDMVEIRNEASVSDGNGVIEYGYVRDAYYNSFYAQKYDVTVHKTDKNDKRNLGGAIYGLYAEDGKLIAQHETDADGNLSFATNVVEGIIYELDKPYYIQEITPPKGYGLDTKKYWFYFGASRNAETEQSFAANHQGEGELKYVAPKANNATSYKLNMELTDEKVYVLPETGGAGSEIFVLSGIFMLCAAFGLIIFVKKIRKI